MLAMSGGAKAKHPNDSFPGGSMNIGRLLGIGLLVMLLAGCQWLSPEDEEMAPTEAAEPTLTTTPIPMPDSTPTVKLAPTKVPTLGPTPTATPPSGRPMPTERPTSPPPPDSADTQAMPIPERPFQDNFWSNAGVQEARATLDRGTDFHALDGDGLAPLHIVAAVNPDSAVMRLLLDQGADIMTLDARGRMPLHWAAGFNSLEMVSLLIDSGSEVHGLDERGETPLHSAAATNPDPRVADLLLDNGAQLDGETEHGRTPLSKAVISNGQTAVVEFLLDQGAGTEGEDESGFALLHLAAFSGASDVVRLLLERGFDPNAGHDEGSGPPLFQAAMGGDPLVVQALLEYGADVRLRSRSWGWTPLHFAVSVMTTGYAKGTATEVAQLLLDQGVDIHAQDNEGRTPLHLAVTYDAEDDVFRELVAMLGSERPPVGATDMVEFLLDQGADIEALSNDRETPLFAAAAGSSKQDVVRLLLSRGSDVGAYNSRGESACQAASRMGWLVDTDVMPELCGEFGTWLTNDFWDDATITDIQRQLDAGADVNAQDGKGETPLYKLVAWNPYSDTAVEFLLDRGADPNIAERHFGWSPLHRAAEKGSLVSVAVLLGRGADLHARGGHGDTALHLASQFASGTEGLETVRLLLDWGAELDARDDFGETPLFGSVDSYVDGHPATTALLLERGADVMARDIEGSTTLHRAASSSKAFPEVVELLLASGADARVENSKGLTPLDMAQRHGAGPEIVRLLVDHLYPSDSEITVTPQPFNGGYDSDADGLIEIEFLEQLAALRYDLDGNGIPEGTFKNAYAAAFPASADGVVCNDCRGYELARTLDFNDADSYASGAVNAEWTAGEGWRAIGGGRRPFAATFNGNGHAVSSLFITPAARAERSDGGLFGSVGESGVIRETGLLNVNVTSGDFVGPLVGSNNGTVSHSHATGSVSGYGCVGGLVGSNDFGVISSSYAATNVLGGYKYLGGLAGCNNRGTIIASYATGDVSGDIHVGGLVGNNTGWVTASYATGAVRGQKYVGGLVGANDDGSISASYSVSEVIGGHYIGGLAGGNEGMAFHNYAVGKVSSDGSIDAPLRYIGGLVGYNPGIINHGLWDTETSGQQVGIGIEIGDGRSSDTLGKTTAELKSPVGYTGPYQGWNLSLYTQGAEKTPHYGLADFWDFGTYGQYPALKIDFDGDGTATWQEFGSQGRIARTGEP